MAPPNPTVTPRCTQGTHRPDCNGVLVGGIGVNWWCTCWCHPEPRPMPMTDRAAQALGFWRTNRQEKPT